MAGDKARKRRYVVRCKDTSCNWIGRRRGETDARKSPCPKCSGPVGISGRGIGRTPNPGKQRLNGKPVDGPGTELPVPATFDLPTRGIPITPALVEQICATVAQSRVKPEVAAAHCGIGRDVWIRWLAKAQSDAKAPNPEKSIFVSLQLSLEKALADAEIQLAGKGIDLAEAGKGTWPAAYRHLESLVPDRWLRESKVSMALSVTGGAIDTPPAPAADLAEYLERARLQGDTARVLQADAVDAAYIDIPAESSRIDRCGSEGQEGRTEQAKMGQIEAGPADTGDGWGDGGR